MAKRFLKLREVGADPRVGPSLFHAPIAYAIEFRVESLELREPCPLVGAQPSGERIESLENTLRIFAPLREIKIANRTAVVLCTLNSLL